MALTINTNMAANNAVKNISLLSSKINASAERLSSGRRAATAKDAPADVALGTTFKTNIVAQQAASRISQQAQNTLAIADGAASTAAGILQRLKSLATAGNSGTNDVADFANLNAEAEQLKGQLTLLSDTTQFGSTKLADGSFQNKLYQVGVASDNTIEVDLSAFNLKFDAGLGLTSSIDSQTSSQTLSNQVDSAITTISQIRATLGALMSRFDAADNQLATSINNLESTLSTITDVDFVAESANFSQLQVQMNVDISVAAQSSQMQNALLKLIS